MLRLSHLTPSQPLAANGALLLAYPVRDELFHGHLLGTSIFSLEARSSLCNSTARKKNQKEREMGGETPAHADQTSAAPKDTPGRSTHMCTSTLQAPWMISSFFPTSPGTPSGTISTISSTCLGRLAPRLRLAQTHTGNTPALAVLSKQNRTTKTELELDTRWDRLASDLKQQDTHTQQHVRTRSVVETQPNPNRRRQREGEYGNTSENKL